MKYLKTILLLIICFAAGCSGGGPIDYDNWITDPYYLEQRADTQYNQNCDVAIVGDSRVKLGSWGDWCNYGISADITDGVINRLDDIQANTVVMQVARNDLLAAGRTVQEAFDNYVIIIEAFSHLRLVVTSVIPDDTPSDQIDQLNILLADYCLANGVEYLDINQELAPEGFLIYTNDGVHPNAEGYEIWYNMLIDYGV